LFQNALQYICTRAEYINMTTAQKLTLFSLKSSIKIASIFSSQWGASVAFNIFCTPYRKPRNVAPPIFQQATSIEIAVEGSAIRGYQWNPNADKKILILHGFESRAYNFDRYINPLLEKGYGVVAMDGKAHGNSEGKTTTAPEYAAMIRVLEEKLGKFDGFISHSFGGIALSLYQEDHNDPAAKMVLIAPATETQSAIDLFCHFFGLGPSIKASIHAYIKQKSGKDITHYSINRIAPKLTNPILWIHDKDDDITPLSDVKPLLNLSPANIEFMITEGLGHRKIYKDPAVIKRIIDFI
jgi:pimeloyl-ACP methyl ester carboxylesterase